MTGRPGPRRAAGLALAVAATLSFAAAAQAKPERQVSPDPSRSKPVHLIEMFDAEGKKIDPGAKDAPPISQQVTCNKCHDHEIIRGGWHFNFSDPNVAPGRPGQPWVFSDVATGTQIPVSGRGWPGTYKPADIGLSSGKFVEKFGRHLPGGDIADWLAEEYEGFDDRWMASGKLEINCLGCHHVDPRHNQDEWAKHIERGNFLEAGTAASGLGIATGWVFKLDEMNDREMGEAPDAPQFVPGVKYDPTRFDSDDKVNLDLTRRGSADRCFYCHTNHPVKKNEWQVEQDVHITQGLTCTECHRNGLGHAISRNYEGEAATSAPGYTCRGCHLGDPDAADPAVQRGGHSAAPRPEHKGLPKIHLDELSCTTCHSGPIPEGKAQIVQTARMHALGFHGIPYAPDAGPIVQEPVFLKGSDGKIGPYRVVFPAFFGRLKEGKVSPMLPAAVVEDAGVLATPPNKRAKPPTAETIAQALKALGDGAVYIGGGKLHKLGGDGKLTAGEHEAAHAYAWPIGHDVRPASQALGAGGQCTDCHAAGAPFLFGQVAAEVPADCGETEMLAMEVFHQQDTTFHKVFALMFVFRPWFKLFGFCVAGVLTLLIVGCGLPGLGVLLGRKDRYNEVTPDAAVRAGLLGRLMSLAVCLATIALLITGLAPILAGEVLHGWALLTHTAIGGAFIGALLLMGLLRAGACRAAVAEGIAAGPFDGGQIFAFWAEMICAVVVILSMMVSMLPIFGPEGLEVLREVHRYSGLGFALFGLFYVFWTLVVRGLRRA